MGEKGKRVWVYFVILWKRMWKTHKLFPVFFVLPMLLLVVDKAIGVQETVFKVAVYMESLEEYVTVEKQQTKCVGEMEVLRERLENREGAVQFCFYDSEEEVKRAVAAAEAECGYLISADLFERIEKGRYRRSIKSYESPQTSMQSICEETLFAEIFAVYEESTFGEQAAELLDMEIEEKAEKLLEKYLYNGSTFAFTYESAGGEGDVWGNAEKKAGGKDGAQERAHFIPLRGIMALLIYICGLCGTLDALEDERKGKTARLKGKRSFQLLTIYMPVLVMSTVTLLCLMLSGSGKGLWEEVVLLVYYQFLLLVYCVLLKGICKKEERLVAAMPVLILAAVVVCPVFVDLSAVAPICRVLEKAFPLAYYLR